MMMSISAVGLLVFDESRTVLLVDDPAIRRRKMFNGEHLIRLLKHRHYTHRRGLAVV